MHYFCLFYIFLVHIVMYGPLIYESDWLPGMQYTGLCSSNK